MMKRFAVFQCVQDTDYVKNKYGGYFGVFMRMLEEEGENWDVFHVADGDFPDDREIQAYDGFVITGSRKDAFGDDSWICELLTLLNKLHLLEKKILGICFGHQILARVLGGKVARANSGADIGVRTINLSSSTQFFANLEPPSTLSVIKCHQDEVYELPSDVELLAGSDKTRVEMFRYRHHIMGIQGHPEYTNDILINLVDCFLQHPYIEESYAMEIKAKLEIKQPDTELWKELCTSFLKGRL